MKATYIKSGLNFLPAIKYYTGKVELLWGDALASAAAAKKYAQVEINTRNNRP